MITLLSLRVFVELKRLASEMFRMSRVFYKLIPHGIGICVTRGSSAIMFR